MLTVGPCSRRVVTASQAAMAAAASGTSQTTEKRRRPRLTAGSRGPRRGGTGGAGAPGLTRSSVVMRRPPGHALSRRSRRLGGDGPRRPLGSPVAEAVGVAGREAAVRPVRADDQVRRPVPAAAHADGELRPLRPAGQGPLQDRLDDLPRDDGAGGLRAGHLEPGAAEGGLHRRRLLAVEELLVAGASGRGQDGRERQEPAEFRHGTRPLRRDPGPGSPDACPQLPVWTARSAYSLPYGSLSGALIFATVSPPPTLSKVNTRVSSLGSRRRGARRSPSTGRSTGPRPPRAWACP